MQYKEFYPRDKVITILDYEDIPSGTAGTVVEKWIGNGYVVRLLDGSFHYLDSSEFGSDDPDRNFRLREGDVGVVTSGHHHHSYANVGDKGLVYKIVNNVDYYGVLINDRIRYLGGFLLAQYL